MPTTTDYFSLLSRQVQQRLPATGNELSGDALRCHLDDLRRGEPLAVDRLYRFLLASVKAGRVDSDRVAGALSVLSENRDRYAFLTDMALCA